MERLKELELEFERLSQQIMEERKCQPTEVVGEFSFVAACGSLSLAELFDGKNELIVVHNMGKSCTYCTMWADILQACKLHLETRCALVLVSPDDPETQAKLAQARGWTFRMAQDASRSFTHAMGFWNEADGWWPGVSTFRADGGGIVRTGKAVFGPGDAFCPPWHYFSLLGIGDGEWTPK